MASVIPSVLVSIILVVSMIAILGGITQHYASIHMEPALLPAYGTVYVDSVDVNKYTVTIVNRYGYPIRALFTVYVTSISPGTRPDPPRTSFWVDLYPGVNIIDLVDHVREVLGLPYVSRVGIDLGRSYFIIGETMYPMEAGAGLPPRALRFTEESDTFTITGLGVKQLSSHGGSPILFGPEKSRYASIVFESTQISIQHHVTADMGYLRSVGHLYGVSRLYHFEDGVRCDFGYNSYSGNMEYEVCERDEGCYNSCISDCNDTDCYSWCEATCTDCYKYCGPATCSHYDYDLKWYTDKRYMDFSCAPDGVLLYYWVGGVDKSSSLTFNTLALSSINYFKTRQSRDTVEKTFSGTSYRSSDWTYILENQDLCRYVYTRIKWTAQLTTYSFRACDWDCGIPAYYNGCGDWIYYRSSEWRWACGSDKCASMDRFLYFRLRNVKINVSSPLTTGDKVRLVFRIRYVFDYYIARRDPDVASMYINLKLDSTIRLSLPKLLGYIGLSYADELENVKVLIDASIVERGAMIGTESGYNANVHPSIHIDYTPTLSVTTTPVGFISDHAKTYRYETTTGPRIDITIRTTDNGFQVPRRDTDTVILDIYLVVEITPRLEVKVGTTSPSVG